MGFIHSDDILSMMLFVIRGAGGGLLICQTLFQVGANVKLILEPNAMAVNML